MEKNIALQVKNRALQAVAELDAIVSDIRGNCSEKDFEFIRRGVGLSIGKIISDILEPILEQHPEIDNLK